MTTSDDEDDNNNGNAGDNTITTKRKWHKYNTLLHTFSDHNEIHTHVCMSSVRLACAGVSV